MAKLDEVLQEYIRQTDLLLEVDPAAPAPAPLPADPAAAAPAPAIPTGDVPEPEEGGKTKTMTDQGYVIAVQDMLELLSIAPEDLEESDLDIFSDKVNPKNAFRIHEKLQDLISRYGSPTA